MNSSRDLLIAAIAFLRQVAVLRGQPVGDVHAA